MRGLECLGEGVLDYKAEAVVTMLARRVGKEEARKAFQSKLRHAAASKGGKGRRLDTKKLLRMLVGQASASWALFLSVVVVCGVADQRALDVSALDARCACLPAPLLHVCLRRDRRWGRSGWTGLWPSDGCMAEGRPWYDGVCDISPKTTSSCWHWSRGARPSHRCARARDQSLVKAPRRLLPRTAGAGSTLSVGAGGAVVLTVCTKPTVEVSGAVT